MFTLLKASFIILTLGMVESFGLNQTVKPLADCLLALVQKENFDNKIETKNTIAIYWHQLESQDIQPKAADIIDGLLPMTSGLAKTDLSRVSTLDYNPNTKILIVSTLDAFNDLIKMIRNNTYDTSGSHQSYYVVIPTVYNADLTTIRQILQSCWEKLIVNVNILIQDELGTVTVFTYFPFTQTSCGNSRPMIYNRFTNGTLQWNKTSFPVKTRNFRQCPIRAIVWELHPLIRIRNNKIDGFEIQFLKLLSKILNFKLELVISPNKKGDVFDNGTMMGSFKMLTEDLGDINFNGNFCVERRRRHLARTKEYIMSKLQIVLRKPKAFNSFDVLFIPFEISTWLIIGMVLLSKWILSVLSKKNSKTKGTFCGRLQLISWLLGTFLLRCFYEGTMFKFFYETPSRKHPKNLDEMLSQGYVFLTNVKVGRYAAPGVPYDRMLLYNKSWRDLYDQLNNSENPKTALITVAKLFQPNDPAEHNFYRRTDIPVMTLNFCGYLRKFSYLTNVLDMQIDQLMTNGQLEKIFSGLVSDPKDFRNPVRFLSFNQLAGVFDILLVLQGISGLVFLLEFSASRNKVLRNLMDIFH